MNNIICVLGGVQKHRAVMKEICPCLTASMGIGGGYVPLLVIKIKDEESK